MVVIKNARVSLAFNSSKMRQANIIPFGRNVETRVSTNPLFSGFSKLANDELKPDLDTYESDLMNAVKNGSEKTSVKNNSKAEVLRILVLISKEVDIVAAGDEAVILAAGYEVTKPPRRTAQEPGPVTALVAMPTLVEGEVICKWAKGDHADKTAFEWQRSSQPNAWQNRNYSNGSKLLMKGLPSRESILIRARSLGTSNRSSPWCEPVTVFVY